MAEKIYERKNFHVTDSEEVHLEGTVDDAISKLQECRDRILRKVASYPDGEISIGYPYLDFETETDYRDAFCGSVSAKVHYNYTRTETEEEYEARIAKHKKVVEARKKNREAQRKDKERKKRQYLEQVIRENPGLVEEIMKNKKEIS